MTVHQRHLNMTDHSDRELVLRALAKCKHKSKRHPWGMAKGTIASLIDIHKRNPECAGEPENINLLDGIRFLYRSQLPWPLGIYEPPTNMFTGKPMHVSPIPDANGDFLWRDWAGQLSSPYSTATAEAA